MTNTGSLSRRKTYGKQQQVDYVNELAKLLIRIKKIKQLFNFFMLIRF